MKFKDILKRMENNMEIDVAETESGLNSVIKEVGGDRTSADLGTIAKIVDKRGITDFGEEFWKRHRETVAKFWDSIVKYFADLEVRDFKIKRGKTICIYV